jgi:hypothetical protein
MNYIALRDRRLKGGLLFLSNLRVDAKTPLMQAFGQINGAANSSGSVHTMFVLCHGYAGSNPKLGVCMDAGGMGLQLARENVLHANVHLWTAIKSKVRNIVVYACAASNTERGNEGSTADGRYLMGALAIYTEADVYAADRIQWYSRPNGIYDLGSWEGQVWHFPPSGAPPDESAPLVELNDVIAGTAP